MKPKEIDALIAHNVFNGPYWGTSYSADISDAWEVVEKLRDPKRAFSLSTLIDNTKDGPRLLWIATWEMHDPEYRMEFAMHENAPMAICLASLKAVDIDV